VIAERDRYVRALNPRSLPRLWESAWRVFASLPRTCNMMFLSWSAGLLNCQADHLLFNSALHDPVPTIEHTNYDAVLVSLTLDQVLKDVVGLKGIHLWHLQDSWREEAVEQWAQRCEALISAKLTAVRAECGNVPLFVLAFLEPSFDGAGILNQASDPTQYKIFVRTLNDSLRKVILNCANTYYLDMNELLNQ